MKDFILLAAFILFIFSWFVEIYSRFATAKRNGNEANIPKYVFWGLLCSLAINIAVDFLLLLIAFAISTLKDNKIVEYEIFCYAGLIILGASVFYFIYIKRLVDLLLPLEDYMSGNNPLRFILRFRGYKDVMLFVIATIIPLLIMDIIGDDGKFHQFDFNPDVYENNHTIFSQILQEVADIKADTRTVRYDMMYSMNKLFNIIVGGITSMTAVLAILIMYRTRKN